MKRKISARELELKEANALPPRVRANLLPANEAIAMLVRRGLHPEPVCSDPPVAKPLLDPCEDEVCAWLSHYAFRLFLRGAIRRADGFAPADTTRYLKKNQSRRYAEVLVGLGLADKISQYHYRLKWASRNFGPTLEWFVGRELERKFGFEVATGVKLHVRGGGGDLDVVAAAEGKLIYIELKSSPPKNLAEGEIGAFCDRLNLLRPDVSLFVVDTALRLSDKVVPMLLDAFRSRGYIVDRPTRIAAQLWGLTPHLYAVNGSRDLMANIMKAIAAGLRSLSPSPYGVGPTQTF